MAHRVGLPSGATALDEAPPVDDEPPAPEEDEDEDDQAPPRWRRLVVIYGLTSVSYLALAVALWWHVWATHPTATASCGCGDPALFMWYLEWPAYALAHGHNPFYSTAAFYPGGTNMLANTSVLALGIPLSPVTWLFGPVATLNVASTLCPALSALAAFWMLRRWVSWAPAAWLGGLLYGFSPSMLSSLAFGHLMTSFLVLPPLMVACFDEILVRQRRRPVPIGVVLGLLVVLEFFVSTEMLVIFGVATIGGLLFVTGYGVVMHRPGLLQRAPAALWGLGAAAVTSVVLLAYPAWYALDGPAHLSGAIWPDLPRGGFFFHNFFDGTAVKGVGLFRISGYFGPVISSAYVGWGLVAVAVVGTAVWHRDRRLWFFDGLAVLTAVISLTVAESFWVPWKALSHLPVLSNVIEQRFLIVTFLALAVVLAVVVDHVHGLFASRRSWPRSPVRAVAALVVAGVALGPLVVAALPALPFSTQAVVLPRWLAEKAPSLPKDRVLLILPAAFSGIQSSLAWQAVNEMHYSTAEGGGPQGVARRAGSERPGFEVLSGLGFNFSIPAGTPVQLQAVRRALAGWEVTDVVVPDLPTDQDFFLRGRDPVYATAFMTAVLGRPPVYSDGSWVFAGVDRPSRALSVPTGTVGRCTGVAEQHGGGPLAAPRCVLAAAGRSGERRAGEATRTRGRGGPLSRRPPSGDEAPVSAVEAVEATVEGVPAALSLAPTSPMPALGGELMLGDRRPDVDGHEGEVDRESVRSGIIQAGPLALAGLLVNGVNVIVTVLLARLLTTRGYGQLAQLTGIFLIVSMPGSAVIVAVVRRVTAWRGVGQAHVVQRWARRLHRQGTIVVVAVAVVMVPCGPPLARALGQSQPAALDAMVVAGAVWVLLSLDRGLLQSHRNYRHLALNIVVEGAGRSIGMLCLVGAGFGVLGATLAFLGAEVLTAVHARVLADRVWAEEARDEEAAAGAQATLRQVLATGAPVSGVYRHWRDALRRHDEPALMAERRPLVLDLVTALAAMALLAVLQNIDVIVFARQSPHLSGSYAAISVASKAVVFGAVALGGYLLPEAAIRWQAGGHALRQLAVTLLLLAVPACGILVVAFLFPHLLLTVIFSARYLGAQSAFAPLVLAMMFLSVTVVLTMYLLAIGQRWISAVLFLGALAATLAVVAAQGHPRTTARADLVVQAGLALAVAVGFAAVHHRRLRPR